MNDDPVKTRAPGWVPPMEFDPERAVPAPVEGEDGAALDGEVLPPEARPRRRWAWRVALLSAVALFAVSVGIDTAGLLLTAYAISPWLGGAVAALVVGLVGGLGLVAGRELRAYLRLGQVDALRAEAGLLAAGRGHGRAGPVVAQVAALYGGRLAAGRDALSRAVTDAHDDRETLDLAERLLLAPLDNQAYRLVLRASRDTALFTAVSPVALLDVAVALWRNLKLVREIASLYAARPGLVGTARLLKRVLANLAIAGVVDSSQDLVAGALGAGVAGALSARVGQGVVNGLLTARVGIAAMQLCRPLPFTEETRPSLARIRQELLKPGKDGEGR
ncbi:MAG TPA: TIGR01620 family protein [Azospirillaceae bacterium]|nr:TIGR01620 family protein [Azospirillaceae bacterium]